MRVGIVGNEGSKFTPEGKQKALEAIAEILRPVDIKLMVSGHCHLGGIDIWAEEIADTLGIDKLIFPPKVQSWEHGYKPRNLQIVENSDKVYCITVNKLPPEYKGMTFKECYHCRRAGRDSTNHVKSGGCWTAFQAQKLGKQAEWIVVDNGV